MKKIDEYYKDLEKFENEFGLVTDYKHSPVFKRDLFNELNGKIDKTYSLDYKLIGKLSLGFWYF